MTSHSIILPLPPSSNNMFVNVPGRGRVKSKAYREWCDEAGWTIKLGLKWRVSGRIRMEIYLPHTMRGDISNRIKALEDILVTHDRIDDDRNIVSLLVLKTWVLQKTCRVEVSPA